MGLIKITELQENNELILASVLNVKFSLENDDRIYFEILTLEGDKRKLTIHNVKNFFTENISDKNVRSSPQIISIIFPGKARKYCNSERKSGIDISINLIFVLDTMRIYIECFEFLFSLED